MSKTWQTRLNDTIRKVRDEQGDAVGDILQGLVDGLPDDAKERISRDLSLGWRIWWNRGAQETENRRVRRANALTDRIVGELPPLATAVGEAVRQIPLNSVKELELRLLAPAQFYMGFIGSAVGEQQTTEYQYRWALANTWANSCGGFSAVLKDGPRAKRQAATAWPHLANGCRQPHFGAHTTSRGQVRRRVARGVCAVPVRWRGRSQGRERRMSPNSNY